MSQEPLGAWHTRPDHSPKWKIKRNRNGIKIDFRWRLVQFSSRYFQFLFDVNRRRMSILVGVGSQYRYMQSIHVKWKVGNYFGDEAFSLLFFFVVGQSSSVRSSLSLWSDHRTCSIPTLSPVLIGCLRTNKCSSKRTTGHSVVVG